MDEDGAVVEEPRTRRQTRSSKAAKIPPPKMEEVEEDTTSSSGTSSDEEETGESDVDEEDEEVEGIQQSAPEGSTVMGKPALPVLSRAMLGAKAESSRPISSSSTKSLTIKIPPATPAAGKVHPLEALYKRSKPGTDTPGQNSDPAPFSFFEAENDKPSDGKPLMPMTPFSQNDFEWRNIRSAAPTPDTAHPSSRRAFWAPQDEDEDDEEEDAADEAAGEGLATGEEAADGDAAVAEGSGGQPATSDFQKFFWENRADLNRSWMKRRKTAKKEKRYKENKARASRST